jgi:hypothetical protein
LAEIKKITARSLSTDSLVFFHYNHPVTKGLRVWDKAPLVMPLWVSGKLMLGVNVHWIPSGLRRHFIGLLLKVSKYLDAQGKIKYFPRLYYEQIAKGKFDFAKGAVRKYYVKRMTTIYQIPPEIWERINPSVGKFKARKVYADTLIVPMQPNV